MFSADLASRPATAEAIGKKAKAILIFPKVTKAGLVFGGSYGEGVGEEPVDVDPRWAGLTAYSTRRAVGYAT
jgi:lipid-binding SYLF domain-containing protein